MINQRYDIANEELKNQKLELFEIPKISENPSDNKFLLKMKQQKAQKEQNQGVESQVINLGFVRNMAQQLSANHLAASGIQLSLREDLIKFISSMQNKT